MSRWIALGVMIAALSACSSFDVGRYGVSVENVAALKKLGGPKVNVGQFTAKEPGKTKIACRAVGPITTPDERPFEEFIRKALIDELTVADMLSDSAPVTLTGQLNKIDFDSMAGEWELDLTVASSNGRSLNVSDKYKYGFTYWSKPNGTAEQFDRASRECARDAAPTPTAAAHGIVDERIYRACLSALGWRREKQWDPPPPGWFRGIE